MNFNDVKIELQNGNIMPIYVLEGDSFFADKTIELFRNHFNLNDMSVTYFNDENFDVRQIMCVCQQFSFFDEKRLVVISNISKELKNDDKALFLEYAKNPNKNCILAIKCATQNNVFNFLKGVERIDCKATEYFSSEYIASYFKGKNIKVEGQAIKKLISYCLNDFTKINVELQKLSAYLYGKDVLTEHDIDDLVYKDTEIKVFDLTTALTNMDITRVQNILTQMFMAQEQPTKILGLICSHFRRLFFVKLNKDKQNDELAKLLKVKEFAIIKARELTNSITIQKLKQIEELCLQTDFMLKDGQMTQENIVYFLVYKIYIILKTDS